MAVPAAVSSVVPGKWMSVQLLAEASQKFTWPTVTAVDPAFTVAVSATTFPAGTVVTVPAPEVTANVDGLITNLLGKDQPPLAGLCQVGGRFPGFLAAHCILAKVSRPSRAIAKQLQDGRRILCMKNGAR